MSRIVTIVGVGAALVATSTNVFIYLNQPVPLPPHQEPLSAPVAASDLAPTDSVEMRERSAAARRIIRQSRNVFLSGDAEGRAEWRSPVDDGDNRVTCGVTPEQRYMIYRNRLGETRFEEPMEKDSISFNRRWEGARCAKTAPVNQQAIMEAQNKEELYNLTHPIDLACMKQSFQLLRTDRAAYDRHVRETNDCREAKRP